MPLLALTWEAPALHSLIEAFGSFSAMALAALAWLLWWSRREFGAGVRMAAALLAMGILDGIHAAVGPGPAFVWLHSLAVGVGGALFALVWLPDRPISERAGIILPLLASGAAAALGISVAFRPDFLPPPFDAAGFTAAAVAANMLGGAGFLAAALRLARAEFFAYRSWPLAVFLALQGAGGLIFPFSTLWDPIWWTWHVVRVAGYWIALGYLFAYYRQEADQAEETRRELESLRRADELKNRFLGMLSHELRTPLNSVLGFGSMLEDELAGPLNGAQRDYLGKMLGGANVLLALIDDLLDMSRIQAGRFSLSMRLIDFPEVISGVLSSLQPLAASSGVRLSSDVADLPPLRADDQRLGQVLYNLVGNAIKFTPPGGTITVRVERNGDVRCAVRDTGQGIAADDIPKLFRPFSQLAPPGTSPIRGTGLGLSISKALIEAHGGTIGVVSEPGRGSEFWFTLPGSAIVAEHDTR